MKIVGPDLWFFVCFWSTKLFESYSLILSQAPQRKLFKNQMKFM